MNKKTYGETNTEYVGFMDDLTPCRVKRSVRSRPWFRLNGQFMDVKKNRCFSGPPTHLGYCAEDVESAKKLFFWYALARAFVQVPYPMWLDADDLWGPLIPAELAGNIFASAFAIGFAENECVETYFPANNPVPGAREVFVDNPLTPLNPQSFWSTEMMPFVKKNASPSTLALVQAVDEVFATWKCLFGNSRELSLNFTRPYFVDSRSLSTTAGLVQIRDYANENKIPSLLAKLVVMQEQLKSAKAAFQGSILAENGVNYLGPSIVSGRIIIPAATEFQKVLCRRLSLSGLLVRSLCDEPNFGRTKLAKLFYLADMQLDLRLQTNYVREAAGPLDQRTFYNEKIGIEALAEKYQMFSPIVGQKMVRYSPLPKLEGLDEFAKVHLGDKAESVLKIASLCHDLTTDQTEIIATLYACWNDLLVRRAKAADDSILSEFLNKWHPKKGRFSTVRLTKALLWMRENDFVPIGHGKVSEVKIGRPAEATTI